MHDDKDSYDNWLENYALIGIFRIIQFSWCFQIQKTSKGSTAQ